MSKAELYFLLPPKETQKPEEPFVLNFLITPDGYYQSFKALIEVSLPTIKESITSNVPARLYDSETPTQEMITAIFKDAGRLTWERFKYDRRYAHQVKTFLIYAKDNINNIYGTKIELDFIENPEKTP
jgi:hypothetical protein